MGSGKWANGIQIDLNGSKLHLNKNGSAKLTSNVLECIEKVWQIHPISFSPNKFLKKYEGNNVNNIMIGYIN